MVDQEYVNDALRKLGKKDETGRLIPTSNASDLSKVVFAQESWDNALKKLRKNNRPSV